MILVTEPTPFGLNDLKLSVETLQKLKKPFGVIINKTGLGDRNVYSYLNDNNIPLLMEVPFDRSIAELYSEGKLIASENQEYQVQFLGLYHKIKILANNND